MKSLPLFASLLVLLSANAVVAHGPGGHRHKPEEEHDHYHPAPEESASGKSFKSTHDHDHSSRWWGASLTTGWESRHIHYGVNETGNSGAYTTELSVWMKDLMIGVWSGFGTGSIYQEWDFTVAYNLDLGPVFFIPGYNFRYTPGIVEEGHYDHDDDHDDGHGEHEDHDDHEDHDHEAGHGHTHKTYGNELFFVLGTDKVPYVTPSMVFIWDLNNTPGAFMELRLDGDVPVWKDVLSLQPYALLGLNFGYNTTDYYGWNNFQFGIEGTWKIAKSIRVFAGVNYSVALPALEEIGQGNEVWANVGVSLSY